MNTFPPEAGGHPPPAQQYTMMNAATERTNLNRRFGELYVYLGYTDADVRKFKLEVEQQPIHSRMCGVGEKSMCSFLVIH